jgi:hypothetical protein
MTKQEIIKALAERFKIEAEEDGAYDLSENDWQSGCRFNGEWLSLANVVECIAKAMEKEEAK